MIPGVHVWDDHVPIVANSIKAKLNNLVAVQEPRLTKQNAVQLAPTLKTIWYSFSHAASDGNGDFRALMYENQVEPADLPNGLQYKLVFPTGCKSAQQTQGSVASAFATKFGAEAYLGWTDNIEAGYAAEFGQFFFDELIAGSIVKAAVDKAVGRFPAESPARIKVSALIKILQGENIIVVPAP
jgi:hypothetical protein